MLEGTFCGGMDMRRSKKAAERICEAVDAVVNYVPEGLPRHRWEQAQLLLVPVMLLLGLSLVATLFVISGIRRSIYNRSRNLKYAKLQSKSHGKRGKKAVLPLPPDFAEKLGRQWDRVHDSLEEMLRFGEMLIELDDYVDNSFIRDDNDNIVGRMPGMKGFLTEHCPYVGYKTAMRFRSLAMKARKVARVQRVKPSDVCTDCKNAHELGEKLDVCLGVDHRRMAFKRRRPRRLPDNSVFVLRERMRSALSQLDTAQRRRYLHALRELIREHSVS